MEMVASGVCYVPKKDFLSAFQNLDFLSLQGATIGSFGINQPFMCNGANFAYSKQFFKELNGFQGNETIASGDDVFLLQRNMPPGKELNVHLYVRHSRSGIRNAANALQDIAKELGIDALGQTENILGTTATWLEITKKALPHIGKALARIPDRDMGFISMFERFGDEFLADGEIDRKKTGGFCTIVYSWAVEMK